MKNKYKETIDKISIDDNVKENILNQIEKNKVYKNNYRFSYLAIITFVLLGATSVFAYSVIKNTSWGGVDRVTKDGTIIHEEVKNVVKTNVDNLNISEDGVTSDLMTIDAIKSYLGIDLISFNRNNLKENKNSRYFLESLYVEFNNKVQGIIVEQQGITNEGQNLFLRSYMITKNLPEDERGNYTYDTGYSYDSLVFDNTIKIDKLNVFATFYKRYKYNFEKELFEDEYAYHVEFTNNNIKYTLDTDYSTNYECLLKVLNNLEI